MGLNVGIFCSEELFHTGNGQLLNAVNHLAAAIITVAWIAFGIFVGEA